MKKLLSLIFAFALLTSNLFAATLEMDYMEYATDGAAQTAYVSNALLHRSNADIYSDEFTDISSWTDGDGGDGASTQVTFDSKSCLKHDSGSAGNWADRTKDVGSFSGTQVFSFNLYCGAIGTLAAGDRYLVEINYVDFKLTAYFATDGLFVSDGAANNEVGTNLVQTGVWQEWTFKVYGTTAATATCDVYLDSVLKASGVDCSNTGSFTNGNVYLDLYGATSANRIVYIDWLKAGSDFAAEILQSYSEGTIKTQGSYALKGTATTGALNKTLTRTYATNGDLTSVNNLKFDAYSSRTGSNIKLGIHDTGGTTTEITPNILSANTWQTVNWDLSAVTDANKNAIDTITLTITNADSANTFYVDNFLIAQAIDVFGWIN